MAALELKDFHYSDIGRDGVWVCCLLSQRKWFFWWSESEISDKWISDHMHRCLSEATELCRPAPRDDDD